MAKKKPRKKATQAPMSDRCVLGAGVYRKYSDEDKASALAAVDANEGNVVRTAEQLKIPLNTLYQWYRGNGIHPIVNELRIQKRTNLADLSEDIAHAYMMRVLDSNQIKKTTPKDAMTIAAIAVDKMRLLRGEATTISAQQEVTEDDLLRKMQEFADRVRNAEPKRIAVEGIPGDHLTDQADHQTVVESVPGETTRNGVLE